MKTVTVETVHERLSYLEGLNERGVGTAIPQQQFELACLRELLARMESRTVTVKLPELHVGVVQGGHAVMVPYPAGHWFNKTAILEMLAAAGIQVIEGEGQ